MYLYQELLGRSVDNDPVRVGLIGAGKFGSMFLSQAPTSKGLHVTIIADINLDNAKQRCREVGWSAERIGATRFMDDALAMIEEAAIDVVVEATGNPMIVTAQPSDFRNSALKISVVFPVNTR